MLKRTCRTRSLTITLGDDMKTDMLRDFIVLNGPVSSVDVVRWGLKNYFISALRIARRLEERGSIRKLGTQEKYDRGLLKRGETEITFYEGVKK